MDTAGFVFYNAPSISGGNNDRVVRSIRDKMTPRIILIMLSRTAGRNLERIILCQGIHFPDSSLDRVLSVFAPEFLRLDSMIPRVSGNTLWNTPNKVLITSNASRKISKIHKQQSYCAGSVVVTITGVRGTVGALRSFLLSTIFVLLNSLAPILF